MINNIVRGMVYFVIFLFIQLFVLNNIHFLRIATPFLYLYVILKMPVGASKIHVLWFSFFIGLVVDVFSNTAGMHAAACTLAGFSRDSLVSFLVGKELPEGVYPSFASFGKAGFMRYVLAFVVLHHTTLFLVESLTLFDPLFLVLRIVASVLASVLLICTVEAFNVEAQKIGE